MTAPVSLLPEIGEVLALEITSTDIEGMTPKNRALCPEARALKRYFRTTHALVLRRRAEVYLVSGHGGRRLRFVQLKTARDFTRRVDFLERVKPTTVHLRRVA